MTPFDLFDTAFPDHKYSQKLRQETEQLRMFAAQYEPSTIDTIVVIRTLDTLHFGEERPKNMATYFSNIQQLPNQQIDRYIDDILTRIEGKQALPQRIAQTTQYMQSITDTQDWIANIYTPIIEAFNNAKKRTDFYDI